MQTENNLNNNAPDVIGITIGGPFLEIRRLTKLLNDFFSSDSSPVTIDKIFLKGKNTYSISKIINKIYEATSRCENDIMLLNLIMYPKFQRYFIAPSESHIDQYNNLLFFIKLNISHYLQPPLNAIRSFREYLIEFMELECSKDLNTIIKDGLYQDSIRNVLDEIDRNIYKVESSVKQLYIDLETDRSGIYAILTKFLINMTN